MPHIYTFQPRFLRLFINTTLTTRKPCASTFKKFNPISTPIKSFKMNNDAQLYEGNNNQQRKDAQQCLEDYAKEIKWNKNGATIIDIGCAEGGVTMSILKTFIPKNVKMLVGCDTSEKMIQFANAHHAKDFISFSVLDIASNLPDQFREKFDHAFSFYALHWVKKQEIAFSNIYDLLVRGGDCLLLFLGYTPVYEVYRELARIPRWHYWTRDLEDIVSPYHDSQDPIKDIKKIMTTIGFTKMEVKCVEKVFVYSGKESFKNAMTAIIPFKIPLEMQEDFWNDYVKVVGNLKLIDHVSNDEGGQFNVKINYKLITVYGRK